jgi:hypothetical protein
MWKHPLTALKGRHPDYALSGLIGGITLIDRALPYPIDIAPSGLSSYNIISIKA